MLSGINHAWPHWPLRSGRWYGRSSTCFPILSAVHFRLSPDRQYRGQGYYGAIPETEKEKEEEEEKSDERITPASPATSIPVHFYILFILLVRIDAVHIGRPAFFFFSLSLSLCIPIFSRRCLFSGHALKNSTDDRYFFRDNHQRDSFFSRTGLFVVLRNFFFHGVRPSVKNRESLWLTRRYDNTPSRASRDLVT